MRRQKKFHYIYKITRFDGKYYIGLHSTDNLDDGYFGSGKYLRNSINYHGLDKHTKEIIEFLPDRQSLKDRERELVNEECLLDPLCMNLKKGGEGGFDHINESMTEEIRQKRLEGNSKGGLKGGYLHSENVKKDEILLSYYSKVFSKMGRERVSELYPKSAFHGKNHTEETKQRMSISQKEVDRKGKSNPMKNRKWISKDGIIKNVHETELEHWLLIGWICGKKG